MGCMVFGLLMARQVVGLIGTANFYQREKNPTLVDQVFRRVCGYFGVGHLAVGPLGPIFFPFFSP